MLLYAQTSARRTRQILADLTAAVVLAGAVWFAMAVHEAIMRLAEPGRKVENAGDGLAGSLADAGRSASDVPLVGRLLKRPFESAAHAGTSLADAGQSLQDAVGRLATLAAVVLIVVPVAFVLLVWLPPRLRWIRRSAALREVLDAPGGADLLALRALTGPPTDLRTVPVPPDGLAAAWRRGDEQVVAALSEVALRRAGLRL